MARLYADENFRLRVVQELRRLGHDVLTAHEAGQANQKIPDDQVLTFACQANRTILTDNRRDFIRLHRNQPEHCGIIVCTFDPDRIQSAQRIHAALESCPDLTGQLLRIYRPNQPGAALPAGSQADETD